jgi:hypothetical protein
MHQPDEQRDIIDAFVLQRELGWDHAAVLRNSFCLTSPYAKEQVYADKVLEALRVDDAEVFLQKRPIDFGVPPARQGRHQLLEFSE